ncbi:MAG: hypothetical protein NW224_15565 [Leptolyngbyaceae cyanobacterium bins.302]|nr:hypothetical protein [Leptolyngbyaceae cyanobacterium bins.302]
MLKGENWEQLLNKVSFLQLLLNKIDVPTSGFELVDLDRAIAEDTARFQGTNVGNPIDRIVGSTSMVRAVNLLSRDGYICAALTNIILP